MAHYRIYGGLLATNLEFSLMDRVGVGEDVDSGRPLFRIYAGETDPFPIEPVQWFHDHHAAGDHLPWLKLGRGDSGYYFSFHGRNRYLLDPSGSQVAIQSGKLDAAGVNSRELQLLGTVLPLTLAFQGHTCLHSSAVRFGEQAAIFLGQSCAGKSTLANYLVGQGFPLIADDCVLLESDQGAVLAHPGYPAIRLRDQPAGRNLQISGKWVVTSDRDSFAGEIGGIPVGAVFVLGESYNVSLSRYSLRDAQAALTKHAFRLDPDDRASLRREFETLAKLSSNLPVFELSYPRRWSCFPQVAEAIAGEIGDPWGMDNVAMGA
ncbi:MAG: hypothetical protein AAGC68_02815 [Verrucomicrobiota bacterium]